MFRRSSARTGGSPSSGSKTGGSRSGGSDSRVHGAMVGTGLALLQRGHRRAAREWFDNAAKKTKDPWLLDALGEIFDQLGDPAQSERMRRSGNRGLGLHPEYSFPLLARELDLTARPEKAAKDGAVPHAGTVNLAEKWQERGGPGGDARATCCMGIYLALTGYRDQAGNWLGLAGHRLAEGPGSTPPSFGLLDCEAQLGMLAGLIEALVDGLPME